MLAPQLSEEPRTRTGMTGETRGAGWSGGGGGRTERRGQKNTLVIATMSFPEPAAELRSLSSSFTSRKLEISQHVRFFLLAGAFCTG